VRIDTQNQSSKIGDSSATTPDVEISVSFEDSYLHRTIETPIRLKFAPEPAEPSSPKSDVEQVQETPNQASTGVVTRRVHSTSKNKKPVPDTPSRAGDSDALPPVAPPPKFPERRPARVQRRPVVHSTAQTSRKFPLALIGVAAALVLLPGQLNIGSEIELSGNEDTSVLAGEVALAKNEPPEPGVATVASNGETDQLPEIRVAASLEPKLDTATPDASAILPKEPEIDPKYSAALDALDEMKSTSPLPPKPQKLAAPSAAGKLDFIASKPVMLSPDPNEVTFTPSNLIALLSTAETSQATSVSRLVLSDQSIWNAAIIEIPTQTDLPAVASPAAGPPPPNPGPKVQENSAEFDPIKIQPNPPSLPVLSAGAEFEWQFSMALVSPNIDDRPYKLPAVSKVGLIAAVSILRPDLPSEPESAGAAAQVPAEVTVVDLRQNFIKPPKENRNSDSAVDAEISKPSIPPPPKFGAGKLKILSQFWQTQLDLEFDDQNQQVRLASTSPTDPDWLKAGQTISSINGKELLGRADYLNETKKTCAKETSGNAELNLTIGRQQRLLPVSCFRRTALSNGLVLEAQFKRRKWKIHVVQEAVLGLSDLKTGDMLLVDYRRDVPLNTLNSIREMIDAAREANEASVELGIIRNSVIETATLQIVSGAE